MATEKQIMANRQNAAKSTGPTSVPGKYISSKNATRHGFYTSAVLLPEEDRSEYVRLARGVVGYYQPQGVLEQEQVLSIIHTLWQLRRANVVDTELFQMYQICDGQRGGVGTAFAQDATQGNSFTKLARYQSFLLKKLDVARKELALLQSTHPAGKTTAVADQNAPPLLLEARGSKAVAASPVILEATPLGDYD